VAIGSSLSYVDLRRVMSPGVTPLVADSVPVPLLLADVRAHLTGEV
jgi:hypothetical protein